MEKQIWFITGISSGLGKAISQAALEAGHIVIGTFRKKAQVDKFNSLHKDTAKAYLLDITNQVAIKKVVAEVKVQFGKIDVLVNNAGVGFVGAIEETSDEEVRKVFEANFFGTLALTRTILPLMRSQREGHIIQISSHGGIKAFAGFGIYNASKFALEGFSEALAQEIAPLGIKLTLIEPGPFRTNFASGQLGEAKQIIQDYASTAGRFREKLKSVHGKQEGDPDKASKIIINLARQENPPLRLPLGKVPLTTIRMKLKNVSTDLETAKAIAESTVYST